MIAKFHKTNRGAVLALSLIAGLALVALTDAQSGTSTSSGTKLQRKVKYTAKQASVQDIVQNLAEQVGLKYDWQKSFDQTDPLCRRWVRNVNIDGKTCQEALDEILKPVGLRYQVEDGVVVLSRQNEGTHQPESQSTNPWLQEHLQKAQSGDTWAACCLWDAYNNGTHGVQADKADADKWFQKFIQNVWVVRFEPTGDFAPKTPGEFLGRIPQHSSAQSGRDGEIGYFRTKIQGNSLVGSFLSYDPDKLTAALAVVPGLKVTGNEKLTAEQFFEYDKSPQESLIDFNHLDASKGVWAVRFEPVGDFSPKTPGEFLAKIHVYSGQHGEIGYFRTTKQDDKLVGSFLAYDADELKAALAEMPDIKVTSVEKLTQDTLAEYEKSPQESLIDFEHLDASQGVWAVRFEPVGDFSPSTPEEFLARIPIYSGQSGEIGYFRTTKQGDKLAGSFLAYDPDALKTALAKVPGIKVTSVEKLTQETLAEYEKSPQESL